MMSQLPYVVAHRGVSAHFPENTMAAFRAAVEMAVDWIELDVVMSADQALIVSHDTTADRCTNGSGRFKDMTIDQIRQLDAGIRVGDAFAGEGIPTLDEVITLIAATPIFLSIEIKGATQGEFLTTARAVTALLQQRDFVRQASIASFDPVCLRAVREWEPLLTVYLDPTPQDGSLSPWALCQQCLRSGANFMGYSYDQLTAPIVAEARAHGLAVWAWTVNDEPDMQRMVDLGVDAILSDDPATLKRVLASI